MRPYRAGDLDTWLRIQATDPFFTPIAETFADELDLARELKAVLQGHS